MQLLYEDVCSQGVSLVLQNMMLVVSLLTTSEPLWSSRCVEPLSELKYLIIPEAYQGDMEGDAISTG